MNFSRNRLAALGLVICLVSALGMAVLLPFNQRVALAEGDKVQGDKGQGTVARWAMFEQPWLSLIIGASVVAVGLILIVVLRRRQPG